jgi:hypothetical protein
MKGFVALALLVSALALAPFARSGHELPVYPSYYPHEIDIQTVAPEAAAGLLREGRIHAYVGGAARFAGAVPDAIGSVDSLGSFVVVRVNPRSPRAPEDQAACALRDGLARDLGASGGDLVFHPYPIAPLHGDYLHHADLAEAARTRMLSAQAGQGAAVLEGVKIKTVGALAERLVRPDRRADDSDWDVELAEVRAAELISSAMVSLNGWEGPPWLKAGWFHAQQLLAASIDDAEARRRIDGDLERLRARAHGDAVERINLEREFVRSLVNCRQMVVGYSVKREYFNAEFSAGIENIAFDSMSGLASPMFMRTVKLKDFPWNGWLQLGVGARPTAAWNPVAGFGDEFGRLMWFAVGDPAALPSPYDAGWVLNRISDVQSVPRR